MAVNQRCSRHSLGTHLLLLLVTTMMTMTSAIRDGRTYRRRVGLLRSTNRLPTDPWQLFNISVTQTGNRTEGKQTARK